MATVTPPDQETSPSDPGSSGAADAGRPSRGRLTAEVWIVLGLSLGQAGVRAVVTLIDRLTQSAPLGDQTATIIPSQSPRPWLDLTYQLLNIGFGLMPVVLAIFLLAQPSGVRATLARIGLDARRPGRDLLAGAGLAAVIGIPGLGLYAAGRALGLSVHITTSGLTDHWWTIPVLVLAALYNALLEEVVIVAWLLDRLGRLGWRIPAAIALSALIRGSYHLYQGPAMAAGNVVMGIVFALAYLRWKRVAPLVAAHFLLDLFSFVGPALLPAGVLASLGVS